jgi:hypothetical protein
MEANTLTMVNAKRIEQKMPLLITDGPSFSWEYDCNEYRLSKFKRGQPERYLHYRNEALNLFGGLKKEVDDFHFKHKKNGRT